ncbi:MAG: hypothetical protein Q9191_001246 [Dirinaria sp. TL-2023a]
MAQQPSEQRELDLVSKVELRIALVETQSKLESTLQTYLPPLLLKLASPYLTVRNKVISGVSRLPIPDQLALLPTLLVGLASNYRDSPAHAASLFYVLLKLLHSLTLPPRGSNDDVHLRTNFGFDENSEDAAFVALWLGKLLLFNVPRSTATRCGGLTTGDCDFLLLDGKKDVWQQDAGGLNLTETKVRAAKFLASGAFVDEERFLPALFASADPNSRLSDIGDDILKRASSAVPLEDSRFIEKLFDLYLGTRGNEGSLPAPISLQTKILALLCKSKTAVSFTAKSLQLIEEGLASGPANGETGTGGPVKQGLEAGKLRDQIFAYVTWLARISPSADIGAFGAALVQQLQDYIEMQHLESHGHASALSSRRYGYESIGLLAAACPSQLVLEPDLALLRWVFNALSSDSTGKETSISIEQALSSILGAFVTDLDAELQASIADLLLYHMKLSVGDVQGSGHAVVRSTRYVAVRFANRCLPFCNTTARWIDILALAGGSRELQEVVEEGSKGLDPHWHRILHNYKGTPVDFEKRRQASTKSRNADERKTERPSSVSPGAHEAPQHELVLPGFTDLVARFYGSDGPIPEMPLKARDTAALFCRSILMHQALGSEHAPPTIDADWDSKITALVASDQIARRSVRRYLKQATVSSSTLNLSLERFLHVLLVTLTEPVETYSSRSAECLLQILSLAPEATMSTSKAVIPLGAILSTDKELRITVSNLFGILGSRSQVAHSSVKDELSILVHKAALWEQAVGSEILQIHGAILATASWVSRMSYRGRPILDFDEYLRQLLQIILDILIRSHDSLLLEAATLSHAELTAFGVVDNEALPPPFSVSTVLKKLKERSQGGDEKAISALGYVGMRCTEMFSQDSTITDVLEILYSLYEVRQAEVQFAVGAALSCVAAGWRSDYMTGKLDIEGPLPSMPDRKETLQLILDRILTDASTTKPALRQASVIWLLCMVQYCGEFQEIRSNLRKCHMVFKRYLSDNVPINRETASRGLTLVYEKGDRNIKDDLVRDLVSSFTGNNTGLSGNVSDQTELFEPGALPTGDNQSITTYKDIMSLACEVGDPSLVYRFMSMASDNAIWSSRAAFGHFGLSSILSDSSVDGYLAQNPKIYPALYRYRFDPNTRVRSAMNEIWKALVKDPTATVDKYFDKLIEDLLKNIVAREWRVRQASCAAIADLVQGRPLERYEPYLHEIWTLTYKVCDDIKGSVREAAQSLARVLAGILTRNLENSSMKNAESMLKIVLPFLFSSSGLESTSQEIQLFSLSTLLDIIKSGNSKALRPHVPGIVGQLVALLSSFENEGINYIHLNSEKYGVTTQQIDDARLMGVKSSPIMEAIERCLDSLDTDSMAELQGTLENAIKTAVGLPSKLLDRNDTVSFAYATACGYLSRLASDAEILRLVHYCQEKLYFNSDDERHRVISSAAIYAVSKHATDRFNALAGAILPFVFVAKHDPSERTKTTFKSSWDENVGGSRGVLLYLVDIIDLSTQYLDSPRWSIKHTSAFAIAEAAESVGSGSSETDASILWPALKKAISGKTWEGKEKVLRALIKFAKNSRMLTVDRMADEMQEIMVRESKRKNPQYRQEALASFSEFVELRATKDLFTPVLEIVKPAIKDALDESEEMDIDTSSRELSSKSITELTLAHALSALLRSINPKCRATKDLIKALEESLVLINRVIADGGSRVVQDNIYDAEISVFKKLENVDVAMSEDLESILMQYCTNLLRSSSQVEQSRLKAAEVAVALSPLARKGSRLSGLLREQVAGLLAQERSVTVQRRLEQGMKSLELGGGGTGQLRR